MKTPIQELIDEMQKHYEWQHTTFQEKAGIAICMSFCMKKLANEKRTIISAYQEGYKQSIIDNINTETGQESEEKYPEQYYNDTFKNTQP